MTEENESMELSFDDFEVKEEVGAENIETKTTESKEEVSAESETKAEAESASKEASTDAGEDSGAESPQPEYTPNFKYNIKDEEHEFPEWLREVVKDPKTEEELRDLFTKANALDGIKDSRTKIEAEHNSYKESVETQIYPVLDTIAEFDKANASKDFGKAWELSSVNPDDVINYMMMDNALSEKVYQKVLEQVQAEPQAIEAQRQAFREQQSALTLKQQNDALSAKLNNLETNTYNQALDFTLSQQQEKTNLFDAQNGQGAFKQFVTNLSAMKKNQGLNVSPSELVGEAMNMLGLANAQPNANMGNIVNTNEQPRVEPKVQKQPDALPNLGTGSNVSMVQKSASNWDDWEKQLEQS